MGKEATATIKANGVKRQLVTLTIDSPINVTMDEAILKDGEAIGYISSGGYKHHVDKSMAMGYVDSQHAATGIRIEVEIISELYPAEIQGEAPYGSVGVRMRSCSSAEISLKFPNR